MISETEAQMQLKELLRHELNVETVVLLAAIDMIRDYTEKEYGRRSLAQYLENLDNEMRRPLNFYKLARLKLKGYKFFASYTGVGQYYFLSMAELEKNLIRIEHEDPDPVEAAADLLECSGYMAYKEAKENVLSGFQCDLNDLRRGKAIFLAELKKYYKKK